MAKKANGRDVQYDVEQFLYRQAELLDTKQWQPYVDLFTEDGVYWMPPEPTYKTWDGQPAIFAEDKNLMTVRMKRVPITSSPTWWWRKCGRTATCTCARAST